MRDLGRRGPRDPRQPCRTGRPSWRPKARIEILPDSGHFPHKDHPDLFVKVLHDFVRTTQPATYSRARWRRLLQQGRRPRRMLESVEAPSA